MINARGALVAGLVAIVASCDDDGNVAPVITTTPPSTAIEHTRYIYSPAHRDADGPSARWELAGGHTCGGAIDAATGVVNFTPPGPMPLPLRPGPLTRAPSSTTLR